VEIKRGGKMRLMQQKVWVSERQRVVEEGNKKFGKRAEEGNQRELSRKFGNTSRELKRGRDFESKQKVWIQGRD
jgi:hypothetical protein